MPWVNAVDRRWKRLIFLLSVLGTLTACRTPQDAANSEPKNEHSISMSCYGFLRDEKLVLHCPGKVVLTPALGLEGFAVSSTGKWLGLVRGQPVEVNENTDTIVNRSEVVNLETGLAMPADFYPEGLAASCGTLVASKHGTKKAMFDFVTGKQFSKEPYARFRCSGDQKRIVGYWSESEEGHLELRSGYPPHKTVSASTSGAFSISPAGGYIAFLETGGHKICLQAWEQVPICFDEVGHIEASLSVSDAGEILFAHETGKECGNAECIGISAWHAGLSTPKILEPTGTAPQWIFEPKRLEVWMNKQAGFK